LLLKATNLRKKMPGHVEERNSLTFFQETRLIVSGLDRSDPPKKYCPEIPNSISFGGYRF